MRFNERYRHGSGGLDNGFMARKAGLAGKSDTSLYIGNSVSGMPLYSSQPSGVALVCGPRGGKGKYYLIRWLTDGVYRHNIINLDFKFQEGVVAGQQCFQGRHVINWNPRRAHLMNGVSINPYSMLRGDSETLVADAKLAAAAIKSLSGSKNARYFEEQTQRIVESVKVTLAIREDVVIMPRLADLIAQIGSTTEDWLNFEFDMRESPFPEVRAVARDIEQWSTGAHESGGWDGIRGELRNAFACMSDPALRASVSPPFGFDFSQLVEPGGPAYMVNIAEAQEFSRSSATIIKAMFTCAGIFKRRNLQARPQLWNLDELGNIGAWPEAVEYFTYGPGYGIRPVGVFQSIAQMDNLAPRASQIILNACGTQIYFGLRTHADAAHVSRNIGKETLEYDDYVLQERARHAKRQAMLDVVLGGADPVQTLSNIEHQAGLASHRSKISRDVKTPDEIMNTPDGRAYVFMPGVLGKPVQVYLKAYYRTRSLAGRCLPDPFHPPCDSVSVATILGQQQRRVIQERVPERFAHLPQYADGYWRYVEGFRP